MLRVCGYRNRRSRYCVIVKAKLSSRYLERYLFFVQSVGQSHDVGSFGILLGLHGRLGPCLKVSPWQWKRYVDVRVYQ